MLDQQRERLRAIRTFPSLVKYLRDDLDWPIETEDFDEIVFDYEPEELGIDPHSAVKIEEIKQLRPLATDQPWGIFFIKFEPKRLPVVVLRRVLSRLALRKRASANRPEQASWNLDDLLFISNYGEGEQRQITFAHFSQVRATGGLPTLKVLGWDDADTALHLDYCHQELKEKLRWPEGRPDIAGWREKWSSAFTLRHREVITTSKELAVRLAELARRIRRRTNSVLALETEQGHLRKLYKSFQEALVHDLNEDDFADMYAQTIAYGLLTARVSRPMSVTPDSIVDATLIANPFLKDMLDTFLTAGGRRGSIDFDELGVQDVVELLDSPGTNIEAILRDFGNRTQQDDPVIYFYELFLSEYDKKKKAQRGVFYTPRPVVSYIVRSVHELLQSEFGLEDGLADTTTWKEVSERKPGISIPVGVSPDDHFVQILDPATGTATFLVEVIDIVHQTMRAKWISQGHMALDTQGLWNEYVAKHLLPRLYGFELMMAPYAVAHMKIGLKLYETGYSFGEGERVHVYLTNSLEPATDAIPQRVFEEWAPALAREVAVVNAVKREKRFTVVIGNPPYANFGKMNKNLWILGLLGDYKKHLHERKINIDDDFIKFVRLAQFIVDSTGVGIISMITNHTFLDGVTHRCMRQSLLGSTSRILVVDLHGSLRRGGVATRELQDENVFDIQQGVAVSLFLKQSMPHHMPIVMHGEMLGPRSMKHGRLLSETIMSGALSELHPAPELYLFVPSAKEAEHEYLASSSLAQLYRVSSSGIDTKCDRVLIDTDRDRLASRVRDILDPGKTIDDIRRQYSLPSTSTWELARAKTATYDENRIEPVLYRVFQNHFTYFDKRVLSRAREDVMRHMIPGGNIGLICTRQMSQIGGVWNHVLVTRQMIERCAISSRTKEGNYLFPLYLHPSKGDWLEQNRREANFTTVFLSALANCLGLSWIKEGCGDLAKTFGPDDVLYFIYGQLHSRRYRERFVEHLSRGFPHIFLTDSLGLFCDLCRIGAELVALHLMESPRLNTPISTWRGSIPSNGVDKVSYSGQTIWLDKERMEGFQGVPEGVWNFHIGGYQVCEKWLKDRKGRVLSAADIDHYQKIVVALHETIRLMKEIDEAIDEHGGWPRAFAEHT